MGSEMCIRDRVSMFAKLLAGSRKPLPAVDVIRMATIEGARALSLNLKTGSLEVGKQADLIRISLAAPRFHPIYGPDAARLLQRLGGPAA